MKVLVLQHIPCEHPGIFRELLTESGVVWQAVELDAGEPIPQLEGFDALWVMGGPMDVWDEADCPWLVPEKTAIRRWVKELQRPYLGFCLGHQLLAAALDGQCAMQASPEIGILDVHLTEAGQRDPLFAGIEPDIRCLQWHSVEVSQPPAGAVLLASSPLCRWQAMRVGSNAYGVQFHVELQNSTIPEWGAVPAYGEALDQLQGPGSLGSLQADAEPYFPLFARNARQLLHNFLGLVAA